MANVVSINMSAVTGIEKTSVDHINLIEDWGLEGDAHAGTGSRQISIFPIEALELVPSNKMKEVLEGGYTENITISGLPVERLSIGVTLRIGKEAEVEIFHIGKEEPKEYGRPYIVSREGRFGKVIKSGKVMIGDMISIL